jgi:hypothetical protein
VYFPFPRQSERERAELERETLRVKALAEAEGRAFERRQNEDVYRRELLTKMDQEREKLLAAINTTFHQIGVGVYGLLSDREKLIRTVAVTTALAAGVYTTREGARVVGRWVCVTSFWSHSVGSKSGSIGCSLSPLSSRLLMIAMCLFNRV